MGRGGAPVQHSDILSTNSPAIRRSGPTASRRTCITAAAPAPQSATSMPKGCSLQSAANAEACLGGRRERETARGREGGRATRQTRGRAARGGGGGGGGGGCAGVSPRGSRSSSSIVRAPAPPHRLYADCTETRGRPLAGDPARRNPWRLIHRRCIKFAIRSFREMPRNRSIHHGASQFSILCRYVGHHRPFLTWKCFDWEQTGKCFGNVLTGNRLEEGVLWSPPSS